MMSILQNAKLALRRSPFLFKFVKKVTGTDLRKSRIRNRELKQIETTTPKQNICLLNFNEKTVAVFDAPVSQAATFEQMNSISYKNWCTKLNEESNFHRKSWEYCYILQCLEVKNKLFAGSKGLGFGVGQEPIVAYMAKVGCEITATDLDADRAFESGWSQTRQYSQKLLDLNQRRVCTDEQLKKSVSLLTADMNAIPDRFLKGQYDFVWSACALEHLGSIEAGIQFILNSIRALKPGGVAVHTTEFNISSNTDTIDHGPTVLYRKADLERIAELVAAQNCTLHLNFDLGSTLLDNYYDVPPFSDFHHLRLKLDKYVITSYGFLIQKND